MSEKKVTKITVIPPIAAIDAGVKPKRRVAAYCRVSTLSEEQETSLVAQQDYYFKYIMSREDWEFVNIYYDDGISGLSFHNREGFNRMVEDALAGRIDLIITKSLSRFARNTVDTLVIIRKLKANNIEVYALGALEIFDGIYDIEEVRMTIFQPRKSNISVAVMAKDDLIRWADTELYQQAELAYEGQGSFSCGEWCRFCKAKAECRERANANMELARFDFVEPALLDDTEIAEILGKVDALAAWASDVKEFALQQAVSGKDWPGWKLVEGRSNRRYFNENAVVAAVTQAGYDPYEKKVLGITAMQKALGKTKFEELVAPYVEKPQGKPTLVPESDKRPAMNTAKNDFTEEF